jgi:hypothetical protein
VFKLEPLRASHIVVVPVVEHVADVEDHCLIALFAEVFPCHALAGGTAPQRCKKDRRMTAFSEMPIGSRVDAQQLYLPNRGEYIRFWHKADITNHSTNVRFWR